MNHNLTRYDFNHMPALMRVLWDLYWSAMDMDNSQIAMQATSETRIFFDQNTKGPTKQALMDTIMLYSGLKTQQLKIDAAIKLIELKKNHAKMMKADGYKMYDGSWFDQFAACT